MWYRDECRTIRLLFGLCVCCSHLQWKRSVCHIMASSFWSWQGLSPPDSGRTPGYTCTRTSSRALAFSSSRRRPAAEGSLQGSCKHKHPLSHKLSDYSIFSKSVSLAASHSPKLYCPAHRMCESDFFFLFPVLRFPIETGSWVGTSLSFILGASRSDTLFLVYWSGSGLF